MFAAAVCGRASGIRAADCGQINSVAVGQSAADTDGRFQGAAGHRLLAAGTHQQLQARARVRSGPLLLNTVIISRCSNIMFVEYFVLVA